MNHSAALSVDGRLFTWGRGKYGQLGHGDFRSASTPEPVRALLGARLTQVCGVCVGGKGSWDGGHNIVIEV